MSSRRCLPSKQSGTTATCGWGTPLSTYFCTVLHDPEPDDGSDSVILWLGLERGEVRTPEEMVDPLRRYADLDATMLGLLRADRANDLDRGPSRLQRQSHDALNSRKR